MQSGNDRKRQWQTLVVQRAARFVLLTLGALALLQAPLSANADPAGDVGLSTLRTYCSGCHTETTPAHFQRLSILRKSPEGWVMTIFRMQHVHSLTLPDDARDAIVKYLADKQGLAPAESAPARFALERRPNWQDLQMGDDLPAMCGRCHTLARVALQRRDADEWLKHMHMHVGQYPSLEYQASGRDRYWWQTATTVLPAKLAEMFPLDTAEWRSWKIRPRVDLSGEWLVRGRMQGRGDYFGSLSVASTGTDSYSAKWAVQYADGKTATSSSKVLIYTGYEWRGTSQWGDTDVREVFALSEDGKQLRGRWFEAQHAEVGGDLIAERAAGPAAILAVSPRALKTGATQEVMIAGRGLKGAASFGPGTKVKVLLTTPTLMRVAVTVDANAAIGARTVTVGRSAKPQLAVVYDQVDRLQVFPSSAIARVGGGKIDPVIAQFEAFGFLDPRSGSAVSGPIALGPMDVKWSVAPRNEEAIKADDVKFAGSIDAAGRFVPGPGGLNPERKYAGNNAGDLSIIASIDQPGKMVKADSHLIVTVQRWVTTPIY